jgi:hypothetical protein
MTGGECDVTSDIIDSSRPDAFRTKATAAFFIYPRYTWAASLKEFHGSKNH